MGFSPMSNSEMVAANGGSFWGKLAAVVGGAILLVATGGSALFVAGAILSVGGGVEDLVNP
ncbi:hypothetical protein DIU31_005860 [Mucilaginibacter rubeus]|uniref:Uncharacterized protein n=1 Tax=Mucilaginibacter rubeus TaxID=2027860 RepID=A0AAE6JCZ4_9SPHI|nr:MULTISPECIES: hypothetical protein [Mucilaginibacter]QEM03068.1 hypothetical protein DIU31_005860 [Mucilaginibacter rubeus]QEM15688.1 hypothetical protein DIU38_005935 [Mucilaginibacter gossypii]QTE41577.1 hypothetical protein J3L19_21860 [Mucilaginibacter rubeus]QTE48183.1 hypothetical protein J3L21_21860 [Mucilaginibacter rubeus]QTE59573.1 hypothetical protein J3L23_13500 [Mucilaginibacter rubeus]